jgi:hypothetical protein
MRNTVPGKSPRSKCCISFGESSNVQHEPINQDVRFPVMRRFSAYFARPRFDLNGAWATGTDVCGKVFVKKRR